MRLVLILALSATLALAAPVKNDCKPVTVQPNFNLTKFVTSHKWFIQKQQEIKYLPANERYCVVATYTLTDSKHVKVHNYANINRTNGPVDDSNIHLKKLGGICGISKDPNPAKLEVGPCRLSIISRFTFGPYWVVAAGGNDCVGANCPEPADGYDWAFVSGGQPTIPTENGLCKTGDGVNYSGMWIFTKASQRNQTQVSLIEKMAKEKGYDTSYLADVYQEGCKYAPAQDELAEPVADETVYQIQGAECGEFTLDSKYVGPAKAFDHNLKTGTCASVGYTVADGTKDMKVPVLGDIKVNLYKKA